MTGEGGGYGCGLGLGQWFQEEMVGYNQNFIEFREIMAGEDGRKKFLLCIITIFILNHDFSKFLLCIIFDIKAISMTHIERKKVDF